MKSILFLTLLLLFSYSFGQVSFQHHQIGTMYGPSFIEVADMDGDGDNDVVVAGLHSDKIVWFEYPNWIEHSIVSNWTDPYISVGDMDNDGDIDVVASSWSIDRVAWFENPGWTLHTIDINFNGAAGVFAIDMDGDDSTDVVVAGSYANQVVWYKGPNWIKNTIDATVINNPPPFPDNVFVFDIDEDTDLDVFLTSWDPANYASGITIFYENLNDTAWNKSTVDPSSGFIIGMDFGDIDDDNSNEIVASLAGLDRVVKYDYPSWTRSDIDPNLNFACGVGVGDINKDGYLDIVASGQNTANPLRWYEGPSWTMHPIYQSSTSFHDLVLADLDDDSDLDIPISNIGGTNGNRVLWFENLLPPDTIHVPGDLATIQAAIDSASNGNIVLVDDGTYQENINFNGKAITVASHFFMDSDTSHISNTIIDGSQSTNSDSGSVVSFLSGEDTTSVLYGFTITGGTGFWKEALNTRGGGGILIIYSGAKIQYNIIEKNTCITTRTNSAALGGGIAVYADTADFQVIIENNTIRNDTISTDEWSGGGGLYYGNTEGRIYNNTIINNACFSVNNNVVGGGVTIAQDTTYNYKSVIFSNNTIRGNLARNYSTNWWSIGGGISTWGSGIIVSNNLITENKTRTMSNNRCIGAGLHTNAAVENVSINNNIITNNTYVGGNCNGGGACIRYPFPEVRNNTISYNQATLGGGLHIGLHQSGKKGDYKLTGQESRSTNMIRASERQFSFTKNNNNNLKKSTNKEIIYSLVSNNIISHNSATSAGGAILIRNSNDIQILNNTITGNTSSVAGGIYSFNSNSIVMNTILWGDTSTSGGNNEILVSGGGTVDVVYSDVQGDRTGTGNIDADPLFADTLLTPSCTAYTITYYGIKNIWL